MACALRPWLVSGRSLFGRGVCSFALQSPGHSAESGCSLLCAAVHVQCDRLRTPGPFCMILGGSDVFSMRYARWCAAFCAVRSLCGTRAAFVCVRLLSRGVQICTTFPGQFSGPVWPKVMIFGVLETSDVCFITQCSHVSERALRGRSADT